jgi:hypothetical protein
VKLPLLTAPADLGNTLVARDSRKKVLPKKRGRPATGKDPMLTLRAPPALTAEVEAWANRQPDRPSRSEALRRLVEIALKLNR